MYFCDGAAVALYDSWLQALAVYFLGINRESTVYAPSL